MRCLWRILECVAFCWTASDSVAAGGEPIEAGSEFGRVARGDIIFDAADTLFFFSQPKSAPGGFGCLEARAEDRWKNWRSYPLTGAEVAGMDASKHDRHRWNTERTLSITAITGPRGFAIVDLKPEPQP